MNTCEVRKTRDAQTTRLKHSQANTQSKTRPVTTGTKLPEHSVSVSVLQMRPPATVNIPAHTALFSLGRTHVDTTLIELNTHKYQVLGCHQGSATIPSPTPAKSQPHSLLHELNTKSSLHKHEWMGRLPGALPQMSPKSGPA